MSSGRENRVANPVTMPEIRFLNCPDKMSEQAQNCSDIGEV